MPGKPGQRGAEPEHQRVEQLDVDAERADHFPVGGAGADQHADAGSHHHEIEHQRDRERDHDDGEPIGRIEHAGNDLDRHRQPRRQRQRQARRAPDQPHRVVEKQDQPEGRQHVIEMIAAVEMPQRDEFQHDAEQQRRAEREHDAEHETAGPRHEGRGEIGAHHVERAMREIDQVHDAEHQRQSRRQQEQQQAELQSVQELFDDEQHGPLHRAGQRRAESKTAAAPSAAAGHRPNAEITSSGICRGS